MNAYVEKGILADLSKTTEDLMKADTYLEPLMKNTLQMDGKIYGLPIKFSVPLIFGNEDAKKALQSLESLKAFLEKDPGASVFGLADKTYIRDFLFQMYQEEIFGEDGKVNQEKLTDLLELAEKIVVNAKASLFEEGLEDVNDGSYTRDPFSDMGSECLVNHPEGAATTSISSVADMMIPYTVMREKSLTPDTVQGFYVPKGVVGINQNSNQTGIALEFVKYLFSQEVQSAQLDDGSSGKAFWVLSACYIWKNLGYDMILWLAGLGAIPEEQYEAARVQGAGAWACFRYITLPQLKETLFVTALLSFVNAFRVFREAYLLAGEYPHESIYMLQHLFNNWFVNLDIQKMTAAAVLLVIGTGAVLLTFRKKSLRE